MPLLFIFIMNPLWVILYSIFAFASAIIEMWSHTQKHKKSELVSALSRGRTKEIFECLKCLHRTGLTKCFEFLSSISAILRRFYKCLKKVGTIYFSGLLIDPSTPQQIRAGSCQFKVNCANQILLTTTSFLSIKKLEK